MAEKPKNDLTDDSQNSQVGVAKNEDLISIKDYCNSKPFRDMDKFVYSKMLSSQGLKTAQEWENLIQQLA